MVNKSTRQKPVAATSARSTRTFTRFQEAAKEVGETLSPRELIVVTAFLRNLARFARVGKGLLGDQTDVVAGMISYTAEGRRDRNYFSTDTVTATPKRRIKS